MNRLIVSASGFGQSQGTRFECLGSVTDEQGSPVTQLAAMSFLLYSEVANPFTSSLPSIFTAMKTTNVIDHGSDFYHVECEALGSGGTATVSTIPPPRGPVGLAVTRYQLEQTGPVGPGTAPVKFIPISTGSAVFTAG